MHRINMSKDYYNSLGTNNTNSNNQSQVRYNFEKANYMPDHLAKKLVNDILNDKFD